VNYVITVNEKQARLIWEALDLASRLPAGQLDEILHFYRNHVPHDPMSTSYADARDALENLKRILFPELEGGAYYGIYNEKVPDVARVAFDLLRVIRKAVMEGRVPEEERGMFVYFDHIERSSTEELATCEKKDS